MANYEHPEDLINTEGEVAAAAVNDNTQIEEEKKKKELIASKKKQMGESKVSATSNGSAENFYKPITKPGFLGEVEKLGEPSSFKKQPTVKGKLRLPTTAELETIGNIPPSTLNMPYNEKTLYKETDNKPANVKKIPPGILKALEESKPNSNATVGFYTKGEQNVASLKAIEDGFTKKQEAYISKTGQIGLKTTKKPLVYFDDYTPEQAKAREEEINNELEVGDFNNPTPYVFFSTYNKQPELDTTTNEYIPVNKDTFINDVFSDKELEDIGINPVDFDGYLNMSGLKQKYKDSILKSESVDAGTEVMSGIDRKLQGDVAKQKLLKAYIADTNARSNKKFSLLLEKDNIYKPHADKEISSVSITNFDPKKVSKYIDTKTPYLSAALKERDAKAQESYKQAKVDNKIGTLPYDLLKSGWNSFVDRVSNVSATVYDKIGLDNVAEDARTLTEQNQLLRPEDISVSFAKGLKTNYKGTNYIVSKDGDVYDQDRSVRVTNLLDDVERKAIIDNSTKSKTEDWMFSPRGAAVQTTGVITDMIAQVAITRAMMMPVSGTATAEALYSFSNAGKIGITKGIADEMISQAALGYSEKYEGTLKAAREKGIADYKAKELANEGGMLMAGWYALTAPISPNAKIGEKLFASKTEKLIENALDAYNTAGKKGFMISLKTGMNNILKADGKAVLAGAIKAGKKVAEVGTEIIETGGSEAIQENIQQAGENGIINAIVNTSANKELASEAYSLEDFVNTSIMSFTSAGLISQMKVPNLTNNEKYDNILSMHSLYQDMPKFNETITSMVSNNKITKEKADKLITDVTNTGKYLTTIEPSIVTNTPEYVLPLVNKIAEKQALIENKKGQNEIFHPELDAEIDKLNNEIVSIKATAKIAPVLAMIDTEAEQANKNLKSLGLNDNVEVINPENKEALAAELESRGVDQDKIDSVLNANGGFIDIPGKKGIIVINRENLVKRGRLTTGQHELGHAIMRQAFKQDTELAEKIGTSLLTYIKESIPEEDYNKSEFKRRFDLYNNKYIAKVQEIRDIYENHPAVKEALAKNQSLFDNKKISEEVYNQTKDSYQKMIDNKIANSTKGLKSETMEEVLFLFSEALTNGDIKYNETIFTKLKDFVRRAMQFFGADIELETGKDVYNFIKDYNKSFVSGKFNAKFRKLATEGKFKGSIAPGIVAEEQNQNIKASKEGKPDLYARVEKIYADNEGDAFTAGFFIGQQYENEVRSRLKKYNKLEGFDLLEDDIVSEITIGDTGIRRMVETYKPESKVPLNAYINQNLDNRILGVIQKMGLGKQFASDVTEEKGLASEETSEDIIDTEERGAEQESELSKFPKLSEVLDLNLPIDGKPYSENVGAKLMVNIASAIKHYDNEISKNRTITPFIAQLRQGLADDLYEITKKYINNSPGGYEGFLTKNKEVLLGNYTTTYLAKHPIFRKGILKRVKGEWLPPTKLTKDGVFSYKWVDDSGKELKIDRDNAAGRGLTSGPEFIKRNPNINKVITTDEFVNYHYQDGSLRTKKKQNPEEAVARQVSAELGLELFQKDLLSDGPLSQAFTQRAELLGKIIAENAAMTIAKDIDRGEIKFSKEAEEETDPEKQAAIVANDNGILSVEAASHIWEMAVKHGLGTKAYENALRKVKITPKQAENFFKNNIPNYQNLLESARSTRPVDEELEIETVSENKLSDKLNNMLQGISGISQDEIISNARGRLLGKNKSGSWFVPYSHEDFAGLLYPLLEKGKKGEEDFKFLKENLIDTFEKADYDITKERIETGLKFKALKEQINEETQKLDNGKTLAQELREDAWGGFNNEAALRVWIWNNQGMDIPGLTDSDKQKLISIINKKPALKKYALNIIKLLKGISYPEPTTGWEASNISYDIQQDLETSRRKHHLQKWKANVDAMFSKDNLSKMEAIFGSEYIVALKNILNRMETGKNRSASAGAMENALLDYLNGSVAAIMALNTKSAVLQTLASVNYINWSDNNPIAAGKAITNQKQYWRDVIDILNSDYLVNRRSSLRLNVHESEIAEAVKSKNKIKSILALLQQKGFVLTQYGDSFAIASGGATFYRNRINTYKNAVDENGKLLYTNEKAEEKAMLDFIQISEETQQSARPDKISMQQAGNVGRIFLAFSNTAAQYNRLVKKATMDLLNNRGNRSQNISRIIFYGFVQNVMFSYLQQGLFSTLFGDDEDESKMSAKDKAKQKTSERKALDVANGTLDGVLRGLGIAGATVSMLKNVGIKLYDEDQKKRPQYSNAAYKILSISPPIDSKISKIRSGLSAFENEKWEIKNRKLGLNNPAVPATAKIATSVTNIPFDRLVTKAKNVSNALDSNLAAWQRAASLLGWQDFELGIKDPLEAIETNQKEFEKFNKAIDTRKEKRKELRSMNTEQRAAYREEQRSKAKKQREFWKKRREQGLR